jgi:hypothetical protein
MNLCGLGRNNAAWIGSTRFPGDLGGARRGSISTRLREILLCIVTAWRLFLGKLRRFYLVHLRKGYVSAKLSSRMGNCRQCGVCCSFLFKCPALSREGLCKVYNTCRWKVCTVFPLDERDLLDVAASGGTCGYFWGEP